MNRIVASAGVLMMGMAGMDAANVTGLTPQQTTKWWSVSASLRGFYDDNVYSTHKKEGSPGVEFEPSVSFHLPREQTLITAKYLYRLNYYTERPDENIDQSHEFDLRLNHRFSERYMLNVEDSFVYSNEPEVVDRGGVQTTFNRSNATGVRNRVPIDFSARLTRQVGVGVGYENNIYDYEEEGDASRSALLDRVEHLFHVEGEWYFTDTTIGFLGYQFGSTDYTSDNLIATGVTGDSRSSYAHYGYIGGMHNFTQQLQGAGRVGVQYTDYHEMNESDVSPYVDVNGSYTYLPGSSVKLGVKVSHAPTDLVGTSGDITLDQLASAFYGTWTHKITPKITGQLFSQYQYSVFNGGDYDGETESYFTGMATLTYQIDHNIAANLSYSFDALVSDISDQDRSFTRNRVWAGVTVSY